MQATTNETSSNSRSSRLKILIGVVLAFSLIAYLSVWYIDGKGLDFFNTGKSGVHLLQQMAQDLKRGDMTALEKRYATNYQGALLGLTEVVQRDDRDGIYIYSMQSAGDAPDRRAAIDEWRTYLSDFDEIEEVGLYIHRLEEWDSPDEAFVASVRFELIGQNRGAPRPGIDRAFFRMHFVPGPQGPVIQQAELIHGERHIATQAHFVNVGPQAGIDFENQYYPAFLNQPLKFGMLRYGPAGITAADYDNDGYYDLYIPDGVASKLFRNMRNGTFADVTQAAELSGQDGVGVALFADYDNDGHKDLFVSRTFTPNQLFRNNGDGTFANVTQKAGIGADYCTTVASWADYNNDGLLDLYVGRYLEPRDSIPTTFYARNGKPNQLYRNNGDGTFANVTEEAGVGEIGLCLGTAFADVDDDGWPDLYVSNDFGRKTLYHNNGDGTFDDVTVATGTLAYGAGMSSTIGDYDNDGDMDLYVAHIRSEEGWFAEWPTVMRYMINCWTQGVWITDMPLYMQIFRQSGFAFVKVFQDMASGNTLLRNRGDGTFDDVSWESNANPPGWFWGTNLADFDNDGYQDLYAANGWVYNEKETEIELDFLNNVVSKQKEYKTGAFFNPANFGSESWHGWERNRHLRNNGDGTFTEIGRAAGSDLILNSRGTAVADFWNRGVLDIAVAASTDRHALLRNQVGQVRQWLALDLVGAPQLEQGTNRDAVGVRATIHIGNTQQVREVILGDGYAAQSSLRLYYGLNEANRVDLLTVKWPRSGREQRFENVPANHFYKITEGQDELVELHFGDLDDTLQDGLQGRHTDSAPADEVAGF
jgi:hypothetical protein